jgi:hypothetical protein
MKLIEVISWAAIFFALAIISVVLYWFLNDYKTVEFEVPHKILNENKRVMQDGLLIQEIKYCKYTTLTPLISKHFQNGLLYLLPDIVSPKNPLGCGTNIVSDHIPEDLPPGTYILKTTFKYRVNPIREIDIFTETEPFEVISNE